MDFETFIRRLSINYPSMGVDQAVSIFDAVFPAGDPTLKALRKRLNDGDTMLVQVNDFMCSLDYDPRSRKIAAIRDLREHLGALGYSTSIGEPASLKNVKDLVETWIETHPNAYFPGDDPYKY